MEGAFERAAADVEKMGQQEGKYGGDCAARGKRK